MARREEPKVVKVVPKVTVQPEKQVAKEQPKTEAETEGATGLGDTPLGDGGGGDGKGLGQPTTDAPCEGDKCIGDGTGHGGDGKKLTCKKGETLIDGKCVAKKEVAVIAPDVAAGLRKSGNEQIPAPQSVRVAMMHEGKSRVAGTIKLCLGTDGRVDRVQVLKSTGYDAYDDVLVEEIRDWRYKPYTVEGDPVPACTVVTIVYVMR